MVADPDPLTHHPSHLELGAQTRARLLDAAEALFAERGFAGTSVRDITAAAGCNLAAVNYHFRGKKNLYEEVFRRRLAQLRDQRLAAIHEATRAARSLEEILEQYAATFLDPLVNNANGRSLMALIARELLDPQLSAETFNLEFIAPVHEALVAALAAAAPGLSPTAAHLCALEVSGQLLLVAQRKVRAQSDPTWEAKLPPLPAVIAQIARFSAAGARACAAAGE